MKHGQVLVRAFSCPVDGCLVVPSRGLSWVCVCEERRREADKGRERGEDGGWTRERKEKRGERICSSSHKATNPIIRTPPS